MDEMKEQIQRTEGDRQALELCLEGLYETYGWGMVRTVNNAITNKMLKKYLERMENNANLPNQVR